MDDCSNIPNWRCIAPGRYSAGQPAPTDWSRIAALGVRTVLTLRPDAEQPDVDERAQVEAAGMRHLQLPVASGEAIDAACIDAFCAMVDAHEREHGDAGLLIHCGTGNRVGALVALRAHRRGASADEALAAGRAAGLTALEPKAAALIAAGA